MSSAGPQGLQAIPEELQDRESWLDPFDWYERMREEAPVRYDPERRTWDVFRYEDVKHVLDDDEMFSVDPQEAADFVEPEGPGEGLILDTMLFEDPPRHDELRGVVDEWFQPRTLADREPHFRDLAGELLDDAVDTHGQMDVVEDLAYPFPVTVIAELLGIPSSDRDQFKTWSNTLVEAASDEESADAFAERQQQIQMEMGQYFLEMIEDRRETPREDLLSVIVTAESDAGGRLSREEALGMCILLLVAGNITTTNLIANAVRCFAEADADLFDELRGDDRALTSAIEEVLRYRSPVQAMGRVATEDVTMRGETIEAGDRVIVWLGSANRDERQFEAADTFRPNRSPNQHLGFGHGTHYCLGAPLARLEAKVGLSELLDRVEHVRLTETPLQPTRSSFIYGVESLPIRYDVRQ
ncbi:cytochrome P450 [Halorubrum lacusprofundi]|jgi:cytochrome P450|uniref:Cytochrome P450(BM-1) n=1 Tax=Halorubrum lacusprofundi TaxID=2247 RepID=A0A220SXP2_9EURY|nr:cytochrome P450 [Halorubrum lacusprofundi]ASK38313.1 Cytochrome P450(BM-1) [Halorubrum lacusprofundi]MCG1008138.1 cytochrome P450 [Halorubrum lacusprofundi]